MTKSKPSMRLASSASERGAIAVMAAAALIILVPFLWLALDLSRAYNRKIELRNMADAVALAAARALDGTPQGVDKAVSDAATAAGKFSYAYGKEVFEWSSDALRFGTSGDVDGTWMDAGSAKSSPKTIVFAKVDLSGLDPKHGRVDNAFMVTSATTDVSAMAIAGRTAINITPLAICAMSNTPAANVSGELVEYGFRRGVAYDLMRLNPNGSTPENFLVNPIAPPGTTGQSVSGNLEVVGPFVCTGILPDSSLAPDELSSSSRLVEDIRTRGVKRPISVRAHPTMPGKWLINDGHRRFRAAQAAGLDSIPHFVDGIFDSYDQVNLQHSRDSLSPWVLASFIERKRVEGDSKGYIAKRLGKEQSFVTAHLALVDAPACLHLAYSKGVVSPRTLYDLRRAYDEFPAEVEDWCVKTAEITRKTLRLLLKRLRA